MDSPPVADAPPKTRPPTTPFTWACTVFFAIAAVAGAYWWYITGPGRTVDTSGIRPGMSRLDVSKAIGDPDDVVTTNGETAMRYGRTHVWIKGMPGRGDVVTDITIGPR